MKNGSKRVVRVVGIGNPMAGDDAIGVMAARRLKTMVAHQAEVLEAPHAGLDLLDFFKDVEMVILIDAVQGARKPGTIHRLDASSQPIGRTCSALSSHGFGVGEALELARVLHLLPPRLVLYGIEIAHVAPGAMIASVVLDAVPELLNRIRREVAGVCHA